MDDTQQRKAAREFAEYWKDRGYEKGESQPFWLSLLRDVYGVEHPEQFISFEDRVHLDHTSFIDGYIDETHVMIEQKSIDKSLTENVSYKNLKITPFQQAKRYSLELPYSKRPRWIVTCNFKSFFVYDMENPEGDPEVVLLENLEKEFYRLDFLIKPENTNIQKETEISKAAGTIIGEIYDELAKQYSDPNSEESMRSLNILCVRLVFCLYAEDAGIFGPHGLFHDYLAEFDTRGTRKALVELFSILNTKEEDRPRYLEDDNPRLAAFPYVNGGLFSNNDVEIPPFTDEVRELLLDKASAGFDWSEISPTIFGAIFESTLNPETRRDGGMHYTSVENIHKVIDPLFLDDLRDEFERIKNESRFRIDNSINPNATSRKENALNDLQNKLANIRILDPACGSGNFLTESYLSLRTLENEIIKEKLDLQKENMKGQMIMTFDVGDKEGQNNPIKVSIDQFYGIEINDFAVTVARTALWIAESQMLKITEEILYRRIKFLPLKTNAHIIEGNALRLKWETLILQKKLSYIIGNPPFKGARVMKEKKKDMIRIVETESNDPEKYKNYSKDLDYVTAWFFVAARYIKNTQIKVGFVATSSICQGEQVYPLWNTLIYDMGITINFAYTPFEWKSESTKEAKVYVTILGFSAENEDAGEKILFADGIVKKGTNISPYLSLGPSYILKAEKESLCGAPRISFGNQPRDGGNLILSEVEKEEAIKSEPNIEKWIRLYMGTTELTKGKKRYCLWLKNAKPQDISNSKFLYDRVKKTRDFRQASTGKTTNQYAKIPARFAQVAQPEKEYLAIPEVSTSKRDYIPMAFLDKSVIASNKLFVIPDATLFHFGILESCVHMAWMRAVAGRFGNGFNYSKEFVYNTFPWPKPTEKEILKIKRTANAILVARSLYHEASLSELYGEKMFLYPELLAAHQANDKAVMKAYGMDGESSDNEIVDKLMQMYRKLKD